MKIFCLALLIFVSQSFVNPVQNVRDSPDPGVMHVGSFYYATTTGGWDGHKFPIWRSNNLVNWTQ
jgi:beta-xylosidase